MLLLMWTLACGEKEEDTSAEEDTSVETDTSDTDSDTDTEETDTDTDTEDTDTEDTDTEDTGNETVLACEELGEAECLTRADCYPHPGRPMSFNESEQCWDLEDAQFTHCMPAELGCGAAITYAQNPDSGECWWFSDTCTPPGWAGCDYPEEPECNQ